MSRETGSAAKKRKAETELARIHSAKKCYVPTGINSVLTEKDSLFEHTYVAQQDVRCLYSNTIPSVADRIPTVELQEMKMVTTEDYAQLVEDNEDIREMIKKLRTDSESLAALEDENKKLKKLLGNKELQKRVTKLEADYEELAEENEESKSSLSSLSQRVTELEAWIRTGTDLLKAKK